MIRFLHLAKLTQRVREILGPDGAWVPEGSQDAEGNPSWAPSVLTVRRSVYAAIVHTLCPIEAEVAAPCLEVLYRFLCEYREAVDPACPDFFKPAEGVTQADILAGLDRAADLCSRLHTFDRLAVYVPALTRHYPDLRTNAERLALIEKEKSDAA